MVDDPDLEALFGVRARALEALPWGEDGHSFRVRTDGPDYHLKCLPHEADAFSLGLMCQLRETGAVPHVPRVIPARDGALSARSGDTVLVLCEWIEGPPVHPLGVFPAELRAPLARTLGALHAATGSLELDSAPVEDYAIPFSSALGEALSGDLPAPVRSYRSRIAQELVTLERVAREAARLDAPRVLCHADVHGGNLILDAAGALWLFDWDGARLAPCEQDLAGATNTHVPRDQLAGFIDTYRAARGERVELHAELFELYYRRRCLEDLEVFLRQLRTGSGQEGYLLALLRSECLAWLDRMENDVAFVRDALSGGRA